MRILLLSLIVSLALSACAPKPDSLPAQAVDVATDAIDESQAAVADHVEDAQLAAAEVIVPTLVDAQEVLIEALPPPAPTPPAEAISLAAVALIVRFEITSPAYYTKKLQRPVWPGGASGVTWGVGYDGGYQPRQRIAADWSQHPGVDRLQTTAGVVYGAAFKLSKSLRDVVTPLPMAQQVFEQSTLPAYQAIAARTFRRGWDTLPLDAQGSLVATVYNRGTSMFGDKRAEMRVLRDDCVPRGDVTCMAAQYRAMPRHWVGTSVGAGLARRYEATARLAEGRGA